MSRLAYFRERMKLMSLKERVQLTTALGLQGAYEETGSSPAEFAYQQALFHAWERKRSEGLSRLQ